MPVCEIWEQCGRSVFKNGPCGILLNMFQLTERVPCKGMTLDRALHFKDMKPERNRWKWPVSQDRYILTVSRFAH